MMPDEGATVRRRKDDHLDLCIQGDVAFKTRSTLLSQVDLIHDALPEISFDQVDSSVEIMGRRLSAPILVAAMTGGTRRAQRINRDLARAAQQLGLGLGFGSQRVQLLNGNTLGFQVRDLAPDILVLGNIGIVQARGASTDQLEEMLALSGADALCVHLNPAMELVQRGGDRDFRGGLDTLARLRESLSMPLVVKETGCGLSRSVGQRLSDLGMQWVDVSGAGGTSWVGVETLCNPGASSPGPAFWDWGIPTAASLLQLDGLPLRKIATGGVYNGLDAARALALGASAVGIARPLLVAQNSGGAEGVQHRLELMISELRMAMLLTGCKTVRDLASQPLVLGAELAAWAPPRSQISSRIQGMRRGP